MAEPINRTFTCVECSFVFKKRSHLLRHQLIHTNERPHVCDICQKGYRSAFHLNRHLATHSGVKSFKCTYEGCEVACITEWNLKRHIKRTHCGKFKCVKCEKEFRKNKLLQQHLSSEHKNSTICCEFPGCAQIFSVPAKMRHHMKIHTERGYLCPVKDCHMKFPLWSECRLHTVECKMKEVSCDVCGKVFKQRSNLKAHKKIHLEEREVFLCSYEGCGRFYTKQYNLKAHVQSFHMNIRPFVCPKKSCNKSFHFQHLLRNHLENIHEKGKQPKETKERKKRVHKVQRVNMSTISAVTGFIPELWKKMTPEEIKSYVEGDKSLFGDEDSSNDTTQHEMAPVIADTADKLDIMDTIVDKIDIGDTIVDKIDIGDTIVDKIDSGESDTPETEEPKVNGGSFSSDEFETITELVEITPYIYKPVQRVVRRPHLNRLKPSHTITSPSSLLEEGDDQNVPPSVRKISDASIIEQNECMIINSVDLPLKIKTEQEECMAAFNNRFKHMLGNQSPPSPQDLKIHGSCHIQSKTESDSSDNDVQNNQVQCIA